MSLTVTAAQGGDTGNGMLLRVYALTSVALSQAGAASGDQTGTAAHTVTLDTTQVGSLVYGALVNGVNSALVPDSPATTIIDDVVDDTNSRAYGSFVTTNATVTPGSITVGTIDSFPGSAAALEILAAGAITQSAASPPAVSTLTATSVQTAAFSPASGSLLIALAAASGVAFTGVTTMTVSDSSGALTWTEDVSGASAGNYYAGVWTAPVPNGTAVVSSSPVLIASASIRPAGRERAAVKVVNGGAAIYLGGPNVTSANGALVPANTTWTGALWPGDQLYAATAGGTSYVSVLQT